MTRPRAYREPEVGVLDDPRVTAHTPQTMTAGDVRELRRSSKVLGFWASAETVLRILATYAALERVTQERDRILAQDAASNNRLNEQYLINGDLKRELAALRAERGEDSKRLEVWENECWTVRSVSVSYGDDSDTMYEVVGYYMSDPKERVVGQGRTPREAIDTAMEADK